jgi:hypothetical protein
MKYGNIPKKILNQVIGEMYGCGEYTVKDELKRLREDIIWANWLYYDDLETKISTLTVWTKHYVGILVDTPFGDLALVFVSRKPIKVVPIIK